jgi:hypothetical protein
MLLTTTTFVFSPKCRWKWWEWRGLSAHGKSSPPTASATESISPISAVRGTGTPA